MDCGQIWFKAEEHLEEVSNDDIEISDDSTEESQLYVTAEALSLKIDWLARGMRNRCSVPNQPRSVAM